MYMQGLFSMGARRVSKVLEKMSKHQDWIKATEAAGLNKDFYIFRKKQFSEILPWDFIDMGVAKEKLWAEYQEAVSPG
jgi:hypothetical protein